MSKFTARQKKNIVSAYAAGGVFYAIKHADLYLARKNINYAIDAENLRLATSVESIGIRQANIRAGANGVRSGNG